MKDFSRYHWVLYLIGVLLTVISLFFPTMYVIQENPLKEDLNMYFFGFSFDIENRFKIDLYLACSIIPTILLIASLVKISSSAIKLAKGREVDLENFLLYGTLLLGAIISYFLIVTISTLSVAYCIECTVYGTIWNVASPRFGLIGPFIGAIFVFLGYFLGQSK